MIEVYKNKKVLVTGHTGFKGAWLSIWLKMLNADVYGYALDPTQGNGIFLTSGIGNSIHDKRADIRNLKTLTEYFDEVQPDVVFHLAAQPLVIESYYKPVETFEVNTIGTVNVLEAIRQTPSVKASVMVTTDKCYENRERLEGYREDEAMGGHDPYSASKGAAEIVISAYRRSFFSKDNSPAVASARAGNVIGGGDWSDNRIIPDIFRSIENDKVISIRNPASTRPWQHVLEPLSGYLLLGANLLKNPKEYAEAWNFGPYDKDVHTVKDLTEKIIQCAGRGIWEDASENEKLHEAKLLMLDINKAIKKLKWQPLLDFNTTIEMTTEWYMNYKSTNVLSLSQKQIEQYTNKWKSLKEN